MALQLSVAVRNARLAAIETVVSASPKLIIYELDSAAPANCAAAMGGSDVVLATLTLPADWMDAPDAGVVDLLGTWSDASADETGTAEFFRVWDAAVENCHIQGTVTAALGGGDMELDTDAIVAGQTVTITKFELTEANA